MGRYSTHKQLLRSLVASLLLFFFLTGAVGCGEKRPASSSVKDKEVKKTSSQTVDRGKVPETSQARISKDLLTGKITEEQAVILGLKAVFAPDDLPKRYKVESPVEVKPSINAELQWIADNLDKMDLSARDKLEPFILPPDDPRSFFNPGKNPKEYTSQLSFLAARKAYAAEGEGTGWDKVICDVPGSPGKTVKIHYYVAAGLSPEEKEKRKRRALEVREAIVTAWPQYKELLKVEPDQSFDVFITDLRRDAAWGLAWWNSDAGRCEMSVHDALEGEKLKSVTAHELFHCFQLYIPHRFSLSQPDKLWLLEATATWAEHYAYPRFNVEHRWLNSFFNSLYSKRIAYDGNREYSSYPLFFFASDFLNDKDYIRRVLVEAKSKDVGSALMDNMDDWGDKYGKFAVYDWNREPFLLYSDPPQFPPIGAGGNSVGVVEVKKPDIDDFQESLKPGSISYWHLKFNPDKKKINKVVFYLMGKIPNPYFKRQALLKLGQTWVVEDWTGITERAFCRERPGEDLNEAVVIFSNGDFRNTLTFAFQVDTTQKCPHLLTGYTRITERHKGEGMQSEITYQTNEEIAYDSIQKAYVVKSLAANYSMNKSTKGQMVLGMQETTSGSGSLREVYGEGEQPVKILEKPNETILILQTDTKAENWVDYRQTVSVEYGGTESDSWKGSPMGFWPKNIAITKEEIKPDRIKGRRVLKTASEFGTTGEMVIEFEYELK